MVQPSRAKKSGREIMKTSRANGTTAHASFLPPKTNSLHRRKIKEGRLPAPSVRHCRHGASQCHAVVAIPAAKEIAAAFSRAQTVAEIFFLKPDEISADSGDEQDVRMQIITRRKAHEFPKRNDKAQHEKSCATQNFCTGAGRTAGCAVWSSMIFFALHLHAPEFFNN